MALTREQIQNQYNKAFGPNRALDESGFNTYKNFADESSVYNDLLKSGEYSQEQQQLKNNLNLQPVSPDEFKGFVTQAQQEYQPSYDASAERLQAYKDQSNLDERDLETRLKENAANSTEALNTGLASQSLARSGANIAGQSKIQTDLSDNLSRSSIAQAMADADRVLQENQFTLDLNNGVQNKANTMADQEFARRKQASDTSLQQLGFDANQFDKTLTSAKSQSDLILDPNFLDLLDTQPDLARQLLQQYGFNVT